MRESLESKNIRRNVLKLIGGTAVWLPLVGLEGCAKKADESAAPPADSAPVAAAGSTAPPLVEAAPATPSAPVPDSAPPAAPAASESPAAANGSLPHLDENDPTAKALGYRQDSSKVDATKYTAHVAGQACQKCAQYKGAAGDAWGGCNIFTGKQVNAHGWCSAFVAKA